MDRASRVFWWVPVAVFLAYLPFVPAHLSKWDPIQFALGIERFSMPEHQPHPPGYLGHMALGFVLNQAGVPSDVAMQGASLVAVAVAAALVLALGQRMYSPRVGVTACLLFVTSPLVVFYGVSGEAYAADALGATAIVLVGLGLREGASRVCLFTFFFLFGLSGGLRQNLPLFLAPFALWRLLVATRGAGGRLSSLAVAFGGASAGVAAWLAPLVLLAGGPARLSRLFGAQFFGLFGEAFSPLLGAGDAAVRSNLDRLWRFGAGALSAGGAAALVAVVATRGRAARAVGHAAVYASWTLPPFLWFALMYVYKPGHMLMLMPALSLAAAAALTEATEGLPRAFRVVVPGAVAVVQAVLFLAPPAALDRTVGTPSWPRIVEAEALTADVLSSVERLAGGDPASLLVVTPPGGFSFRPAMFYLPSVRVVWPIDLTAGGKGIEVCEARDHRTTCQSGEGFWLWDDLPEEASVRLDWHTRRIVWLRTGDPGAVADRAVGTGLAGRLMRFPVIELPDGPVRVRIGRVLFER